MKRLNKNPFKLLKNIFFNRGKDIIVILIIFLVFSLILEQIVRFHLFGIDSFNYQKMKSMGPMGQTGYLKESSIPEVVFELKPNLDTYYKFAHFITNSKGLRDKEYTLEKPSNTFRVAVVGGSFTMASGVEIDKSFHTLLENKLNKQFSDLNYEFINFGVPGYMINNKLATLKFEVLDYKPDLILFILDSSRFISNKENQKFVPRPAKNRFFKSFAYEQILRIKFLEFIYDKAKYKEIITYHKERTYKNILSFTSGTTFNPAIHLIYSSQIDTSTTKYEPMTK